METSVRFTPLSGVDEESPLCYLLEIGSFTILLDCGWDENFEEAALDPVKRVLPKINAVLLSHPDLAHLGALPYLVGKCGLSAPIFSTKPVRRMGEMFMFEAYLAKQAISDFDTFDLDDVDAAFRLNSRWTELRFSQRHVLVAPSGAGTLAAAGAAGAAGAGAGATPGGGITITPHAAGRFPGGAVWRISLGCGEEVVYAVDYNHRKEKLLNPTTFNDLLAAQQPALLISDAINGLTDRVDKRRRDEEFLDAITATVEAEGSVLIPTDAAGRVLELALLLDEHFARARIAAAPVVLSATVKTVLEFARTQLEYLGNDLVQAFSLKRTVPLSFRKLSVVTRLEELGAFPGPKVVLATMPSLESGPARELLVQWAALPRNTIIFTERAPMGSLAAALQNFDPSARPPGEPLRLPLRLARRVPLEGEELAAWQAAKVAAAAAAQEAARLGSGVMDALPLLSSASTLTPASRLVAAARLGTLGSAAPAATAGPGGGGGGGGGLFGTPAVARGGGGGGGGCASQDLPLLLQQQPSLLRASTGSISKLVRDNVTGAIVQQLVGNAPGAAEPPGHHSGGGGPGGGWDTGLLIDGFEPPQDAAYPMFPDEDEPLYCEWDEYGAKLDKDEFRVSMLPDAAGCTTTTTGRAGGPDTMDVDGGDAAAAGGGGGGGTETDVADEVDEAPTKLVVSEMELEIRAAIRFFDFEGRADGKAVLEYLARIAPRRLALVHGSTAAREALAGALRHALLEYGTLVYTPELNETIEANLAPSQMAVLGPALADSLAVRQAGQYGVAWLEGVLAPGQATDLASCRLPLPVLEPLGTDEGSPDALAAAASARLGSGGGAGAGSVLLAQAGSVLSLSKLRSALTAAGFASHFPSRGVLAVMVGDGPSAATLVITLKTGGAGAGGAVGPPNATTPAAHPTPSEEAADRVVHVSLDGPACEAYYKVREVIYEQFGVC